MSDRKKTARGKGKQKTVSLAAVIIGAALVISMGAGLMGCGSTDSSGDIGLPDFLNQAGVSAQTVKAYQAALDIPDYLEQIPCYCGCGTIEGHKSNLDCFIESRQGDKVEWDDHGAG